MIPLDLADVKDIEIIVETLQMVVKRRIPIRFGFVPLLVSPEAIDQAKIVYHLWDTYGLGAVLAYLDIVMSPMPNVRRVQYRNRANIW